LAGPVVAAGVILREPIQGLKDSKKLTKRQRETLAAQIHNEALAIGIGWVSAEDIDISGITTAVKRAMELAVAEIRTPYDEVIIDGNYNFLAANKKARAVIKADDIVPAVSAASIVAKVARDNFMADQALQFPGYGFEKHVGYGTAFHMAKMKELGVSTLHRKSFAPVRLLVAETIQ
jgi:ribonuclease HII